jgi:hypothetical protein
MMLDIPHLEKTGSICISLIIGKNTLVHCRLEVQGFEISGLIDYRHVLELAQA